MQGLIYGLVYGSDDKPRQLKESQPKDDFEILGCPEAQTIVQIQRKSKFITGFKQYIANANDKTVYYNYIINTTIHEREYDKPVVYTILASPFFGKLYPYKTFQDPDEFFRTMIFMEL
jgi:hypothetical protein